MGGYEMMEANPGVNYNHPSPGERLVVPSQFILPDAPRKGIVINIAEMRLYYYHADGVTVSTFPVGVGQDGWNTPLGKTQITRKRKDPTWVVPDSIYANRMEAGDPTPKVVPPGPTNPLGKYAMNLGFNNIVIHGTPYERAVGLRSSHGCIRMLNSDVEQVFNRASIGTPVYIVHQTVKIGRSGNELYLEAHEPISNELQQTTRQDIPYLIRKAAGEQSHVKVKWNDLERLQSRADGCPQLIGTF
jgi:L,D-transpeptidase ErfK/SrfK